MKKQNKTFAQRARDIESRYKRLKFDPIEQKEFEAQMEKLQQEQEMVRSAMGLNQQEQPMREFGSGGRMMYDDGGKMLMLQNRQNSQVPYRYGDNNPLINPENVDDTSPGFNIMTPSYTHPINNKEPEFSVEDLIGFNRSGFANQEEMQDELLLKGYDPRQINTMLLSPRFPSVKGMLAGNPTPTTKTSTITPKPPVTQQQMNLDPSGWNSIVDNINNFGMMAAPQGNNAVTTSQQPSALNSPRASQVIQNLQSTLDPTKAKNKGKFWNNNKQYLPYAISGASNIAGNLLMAAMAKKNQQRINPVLASPEKMNMEPQAEQLRKDASVSKNIGLRQARDLGLNAGATLANMGAIGSGVDRNLAGALTNLYGQQEQYNTGAANQFALQNQDAVNRAGMMNAQFGNQANQDRLGFIGGALGTIPGVMKDIRMDKADAQMRDVMDRYYQSIGGRNYATVGSIFKDPKSGFTYKVKPDLTLEQVK